MSADSKNSEPEQPLRGVDPAPLDPQDRPILLTDVPDLSIVPRGHGRSGKVHVGTIHRWVRHGVNGVRLETVPSPSAKCTTIRKLKEFFDRRSAASTAGDSDEQNSTEPREGAAGAGVPQPTESQQVDGAPLLYEEH